MKCIKKADCFYSFFRVPENHAFIILIHPTGWTSGLQNGALDFLLTNLLHNLCHSLSYRCIHILSIAICLYSINNFNGISGAAHSRHHLRADRNYFLILHKCSFVASDYSTLPGCLRESLQQSGIFPVLRSHRRFGRLFSAHTDESHKGFRRTPF